MDAEKVHKKIVFDTVRNYFTIRLLAQWNNSAKDYSLFWPKNQWIDKEASFPFRRFTYSIYPVFPEKIWVFKMHCFATEFSPCRNWSGNRNKKRCEKWTHFLLDTVKKKNSWRTEFSNLQSTKTMRNYRMHRLFNINCQCQTVWMSYFKTNYTTQELLAVVAGQISIISGWYWVDLTVLT